MYDKLMSLSLLSAQLLINDRLQKSATDTCNFDKEFLSEPVKLTPVDRIFLMNIPESEFEGFTYVNPHSTLAH